MSDTDYSGARKVDWKALVAEVEDLEAPDPAYEFSRRTFYVDTDNSGPYDTSDE